jgi:phosphoenolpyruvate carboxykinase (GTP)
MAALCLPEKKLWCNGSQAECDEMCALPVKSGTFSGLGPLNRPNSYLARTHSSDVALVEESTFICAATR